VQPDKAIDVIDEAGARCGSQEHEQAAGPGGDRGRHRTADKEKDEAVKNAGLREGRGAARPGDQLRKKKEQIQTEWRARSQEVDGVVDEEVIAEVVAR
jgi:ATP-dependent Clp protease ATP-binding subunit ClpC